MTGAGFATESADETGAIPELPDAVTVSDTDDVLRLRIPATSLESAVHRMNAVADCRLADLFAATGEDGVVLHLLWAIDRGDRYLMLETPVAGEEYPAVSDLAPAAFQEECEIYEQFGLRPEGGRPLNRIAVPPQADHDVPRLGAGPRTPPDDLHAPHFVGGDHAFEFPVGPVRQVGAESLYYGLVTSGEEVVDLYLFTWHKHRGVEWRLRGKTPREALFLVERVEGLSAVAHGWAFAGAVEAALGVAVPPGAQRVRALALELERLYNHAAAIAGLCQTTGLSVGQANAEIALERLLRLNAAVFGHRYLFGIIDLGGVARGPDSDAVRTGLAGARDELRRVTDALSKTNSFLDRLEATGVVTPEQAGRLGLVGPVARAAGIDVDIRRDHPSAPYDGLRPAVARRESGDVLARYEVFLAEIDEAARLVSELCADRFDLTGSPIPLGSGGGLGAIESARGEALTWVRLDAEGRIERVRLRPAAVRNWRAFDDACRSQNVFTDIPIIEASFWLTVAGTAR